MSMYPLIEDAMNKRFDELVASGLTEDEAAEAILDELDYRLTRLEEAVFPGEFSA